MLTQVNYEVKGQLAKLLATEDLIIENRRVPTASFDVEKRVLTLPMWEKSSGTVYDLLVGHEVGHALYTPADNWQLDHPEIPMSFVNVFEDVRIEKLMKQKYPGLSKTFYTGYSQLAEQDFFEIEDKDIEELNLADRINLYYKIGSFDEITFEEDEKQFVDRALKTRTFEEVLQLSKDLTEFLQNKMDDLQKTQVPIGGGDKGGDLDIPFDSTDETSDQEMDGDTDQGFPTDDYENEGLDYDTQKRGGGEHNDLEAETDKALQDNLENLNENDNKDRGSYYDPEYVSLPDLNMDTLIVQNVTVHEYLNDWWKECQVNFDSHSSTKRDIFEPVDNDYRLFRRTAQKEVNYLVKEFECRKSADAYARATVAKTGVIDCNKLHTYKYNEDLFRKITTIPDGKNHGLIFVLDWSGSMSHVLQDTVKQLFNLIWFCKKVQIPFKVYAFTNEWNHDTEYYFDYDQDGPPVKRTPLPVHHEQADGRIIVDSQFSMVEFLSSDCKKGDLENQMLNLWRLSSSMTSQRRNNWDCQVYYQYPRRLSLSGTPLNEALVSLNQIIPLFQKKFNVQKIQCITLTDGEAHPLRFSKWIPARYDGGESYLGQRSTMNGYSYIRDKSNGKTYFCKSEYHELTGALLNQLRGRFPNVNFIGIRVMENRDASNFIRKYLNWDFDKVQNIQSGWKKNKSLCLTDVGYHAYFGLSSSNLNNDTEFEVKEDATKAQIKSAFTKSLRSKKMNKKVLGEFMSYIA